MGSNALGRVTCRRAGFGVTCRRWRRGGARSRVGGIGQSQVHRNEAGGEATCGRRTRGRTTCERGGVDGVTTMGAGQGHTWGQGARPHTGEGEGARPHVGVGSCAERDRVTWRRGRAWGHMEEGGWPQGGTSGRATCGGETKCKEVGQGHRGEGSNMGTRLHGEGAGSYTGRDKGWGRGEN